LGEKLGFALRLTEENKAEVTKKEERTIMKTQLTAIMSLFVVGAFITSGSYAYFSGTTISNTNVFSVATTGMVLELGSDTQAYTTTDQILMTVSNLLPGVETSQYHIFYRNGGALNGIVTINIGENNDVLAQHLWITQASLDGNPGVQYYWALQIAEQTGDGTWGTALSNGAVASYNGNYVPTFYGMKWITLHFSNTYLGADWQWTPGEAHATGLYFMLDPAADNSYLGASLTASITGTINQVPV
jgi:hypothetical protein